MGVPPERHPKLDASRIQATSGSSYVEDGWSEPYGGPWYYAELWWNYEGHRYKALYGGSWSNLRFEVSVEIAQDPENPEAPCLFVVDDLPRLGKALIEEQRRKQIRKAREARSQKTPEQQAKETASPKAKKAREIEEAWEAHEAKRREETAEPE